MSAFDDALDVLFTDPHRSVAGTFTPAVGAAMAVRCLVQRVDLAQPIGLSGARHPGWKVRLRRVDVVTKPRQGDTVTIASPATWARTYTVQDVAEDEMALQWILDCRG